MLQTVKFWLQTVKFWPGATTEYIRTDLESERSKFHPERKSDSFSSYNHVSVPVFSPVLFLKAFNMMKSSSDMQTGG